MVTLKSGKLILNSYSYDNTPTHTMQVLMIVSALLMTRTKLVTKMALTS